MLLLNDELMKGGVDYLHMLLKLRVNDAFVLLPSFYLFPSFFLSRRLDTYTQMVYGSSPAELTVQLTMHNLLQCAPAKVRERRSPSLILSGSATRSCERR